MFAHVAITLAEQVTSQFSSCKVRLRSVVPGLQLLNSVQTLQFINFLS